jgi:hypothetical protein
MPVAQKNAPQVLVNKHPRIIRYSPIKLLVPGRPILAKVKRVKNVAKIGIVVNKPE